MKAGRLALLLLGALAACGRAPESAQPTQTRPATAASRPVAVGAEIAAFYAARGNRPLWVTNAGPRPEARDVARLLEQAADHGLSPERYGAAEAAAAVEAAHRGNPQALARAELLLSRGFTAYVRDLKVPRDNEMVQGDGGLAPVASSANDILEALAAAPSLRAGVAAATRMNPLYGALQRGYARWRAGAPRDPAADALIRANLDRARAIPADAPRYVIVDTASARLWMIDRGKVEGPMRVIVGKPNMQTPMLASRIHFAVLNPWWNMPPDLARERAKIVVRDGPGLIARQRLQILSDWSDAARPIPASAVNWKAVASGRETLRLRQYPGGANVMGAIKFMMPNRLGIYLHDFPEKSLFARTDRRLSSGCVRLSDAPRLARWLFGGTAPAPQGTAPEQRVDLQAPVPVYITYLTVLPGGPEGLTFQPDSYDREHGRAVPPRKAAED